MYGFTYMKSNSSVTIYKKTSGAELAKFMKEYKMNFPVTVGEENFKIAKAFTVFFTICFQLKSTWQFCSSFYFFNLNLIDLSIHEYSSKYYQHKNTLFLLKLIRGATVYSKLTLSNPAEQIKFTKML